MVGTTALFFGPTLYFISQNYNIFSNLAYESAPDLVTHLEREFVWLVSFATISMISIAGFCLFLGLRITGSFLKPLMRTLKHMQKVSRGDLSQPPQPQKENEDFYELMDSYSYLYQSIRAQTESELRALEKLVIDPLNRESQAVWQELIATKRRQLGLPEAKITETVAHSSEVVELRRVS